MKIYFKRIPALLLFIFFMTAICGASVISRAAAPQTSHGLIIEAEQCVPPEYIRKVAGDERASGNGYMVIQSNRKKLDDPEDPDTKSAGYGIKIENPGFYAIWVRYIAEDEGKNSFFLSLDNGRYEMVDLKVSRDWAWKNVRTIMLTAGNHAMDFKYRENGLKIDEFIFADSINFIPEGKGYIPGSTKLSGSELAAGPEITPPPEHPRLFVMNRDIPVLKERIKAPEMKDAWNRMLSDLKMVTDGRLKPPPDGKSGSYNTAVRKAIEARAFMYLLGEGHDNGRKAIDMMLNFLETVTFADKRDVTREYGQTMISGALVYDWCYSLLSGEEKTRFIFHLERLASMMEIGYPPLKQGAIAGHAGEAQLMRDILGAGVAIYDENKDMYNIAAGRFFREFVPARNYWYPAGMHHQGDSYGNYRFQWEMFATWIYDRMGYKNIFSETQGMTPYYWLYMRRPDGQLLRDGDSYQSRRKSGSYWSFPMPFMLTAGYYKDPYLKAEFLKQYPLAKGDIDPVWYLLFNDTDVTGISHEDLPLTRFFGEPMGMMIARTGWGSGMDSDTVVAEIKLGLTWFGGHQHLDSGHFQIYYKGILAADSGIYQGNNSEYGGPHDIYYNKRSIAHNTLLVNDPDEKIEFMGGSNNDGGQRGVNRGAEPATLDDLKNKGYRTGELIASQYGPDKVRPDFSYLKGDLTRAYSSKVRQFLRSFVFLNLGDAEHPAALIVYDNVTSANPRFKKSWLLHSVEEPLVDGNTTTISRTEKGYNGKLVNNTLLPLSDNLVIDSVGGPGKEFWADGVNYSETPQGGDKSCDEGTGWRIEVSPRTPAETDRFLNVMQVMDNRDGSEPLKTEMLDSGDMVGVMVSDRVVLFSKTGESIGDKIRLEITGTEKTLKCLVTDLSAGEWGIRREDSSEEMIVIVSEENRSLYFPGQPGIYYLSMK